MTKDARPTLTPLPTPTPTPQPKIEYFFPYPGILPGHPLYPLKMVRDRILGFFIQDPVKKAEYYLLLADKRVNSGLFLLERGKTELAVVTIEKGGKYLEKVFAEVEKAQKAAKDITPILSKASVATLKHEEVLKEVLEKVPESAKAGVQNALEKSQRGIQRVREIQTEKLERLEERQKDQEKATPEGEKGLRATPLPPGRKR